MNVDKLLLIDTFVFLLLLIDIYLDPLPGINHLWPVEHILNATLKVIPENLIRAYERLLGDVFPILS